MGTVAIIGAGFGGIATAVNLTRSGVDDFVVFEQAHVPGGTWQANTYLRCEVDVYSLLYSFSFMPYDWTRTHAGRKELQQYAEDTIDHFGIRDRFRFSTKVSEVIWDDARADYRVLLADGTEDLFTAVVACVGFLSVPRDPDWPGLDVFEGVRFHTARWEHAHDLVGKRVALVGTGSSAAQIIPELADRADQVLLYQREAGWVVPKWSRTYRHFTRRRRMRMPWTRKAERFGLWLFYALLIRRVHKAGSLANRGVEKLCRWHLEREVADPELRRMLTPDHPFGCKRPLFTDTYYRALIRPNVTVIPHAVRSVTPKGVVAADGETRDVDVLITATGFQAQRYLCSVGVRGIGGADLHERWPCPGAREAPAPSRCRGARSQARGGIGSSPCSSFREQCSLPRAVFSFGGRIAGCLQESGPAPAPRRPARSSTRPAASSPNTAPRR